MTKCCVYRITYIEKVCPEGRGVSLVPAQGAARNRQDWTPLAFADNPNYYTIYLERQGGIGTPEYVFVYRIKTSDGTESYRTSRLPTPTMEGYLFDGWYTDLVGGDKIKPAEYEFQEDGQTLYAHWTPVLGESTAKPEPEAAEQPASTFRLEDHLGEILIVGTTVLVVTLVAMHG